jgi:hypothetical protein
MDYLWRMAKANAKTDHAAMVGLVRGAVFLLERSTTYGYERTADLRFMDS